MPGYPLDWQTRIAEAVRDRRDYLHDLLSDLVAIPSVGGSQAEHDIQRWLADHLAGVGLNVTLGDVPLAGAEREPGFPGMEVERRRVTHLTATLGGSGRGPRVAFLGHTDVVPASPGHWSGDPFTPVTRNGCVTGRGTVDMKGGLAAAVVATLAIRDSGLTPPGDVVIAAVSAEEDGGAGTWALLRSGFTADSCLLPEPTGSRLVIGNAGSLTFRLTVTGRPAHGALRWHGHNPLQCLPAILTALQDLERHRNQEPDPLMASWPIPYPISVGRVRAGQWASTVPQSLVLEGRYGVKLGESATNARTHFEQALAQASMPDPWLSDHPIAVQWWGGEFASATLRPSHPLVEVVRRAHDGLDPHCPAQPIAAPYGSDLRLMQAAGIPTVQYGPGDPSQAHADDETVSLREVEDCAVVLAHSAAQLAHEHGLAVDEPNDH